MLTRFDELTCHQIPSTFDHLETSDKAFTEKLWLNLHDTQGRVVLAAGLGVYPNRNVMDGFACVNVGNEQQHNLRVSRELRPRIDETSVGPLAYEVVEPYRRVHVSLGDNPQGFTFDVEFLGAFAPHEEKPQYGRQYGRTYIDTCRYAQLGRARGVVRLPGGATIDLKPHATYAQRDHSWGIRIGVGQPEQGLQVQDTAPFNSMMINWLTAQFETWGAYYYLIEKADGGIMYLSGAVAPSLEQGGEQVPIVKVEHDFKYHPGSLRMASGRVLLHTADGRIVDIAMKELTTMYLKGGGYVGLDNFRHGTWLGREWSDGETWAVADEAVANRVHGLDDTVCEYESGGDRGYGIIENLILPPFPRYV